MSGGAGTVHGSGHCPQWPSVEELGSGAGPAIQGWPWVSGLELGPLPTAIPCARLRTRAVLLGWQLGYLADDAEVLVSELMTNALNASWGLKEVTPVALRLLANHEKIIIEVWDRSPADPIARVTDDETEHGRGLAVIEALSNRWGFKRISFSLKVVWCELVLGDAARLR
jgi:hypothetical protein